MTHESKDIAILDLTKRPLSIGVGEMICNGVDSIPTDRLLTTVADVDDLIYELQAQIDFLMANRNPLMKRVMKEGVNEDKGAMLIEIPGKKERNPIVPEVFWEKYPDSYKLIRKKQEEDIDAEWAAKKAELDHSPIPLLLADKYTGKECVTDLVGFKPQTIKYEVRRKRV